MRQSEFVIGTVCWRCTIYPNQSWVLDTQVEGRWSAAISGSHGGEGMAESLRWWDARDGERVLGLIHEKLPRGALLALERFAETMVLQ